MRCRGFAVAAGLVLASCAFSSEQALFADGEGVTPFADGAVYDWKPSDEPDEDMVVRFARVGTGYEIHPVDRSGERPMQALFIDIPETPERDYIVQVLIDPDDREGFAYVYMWSVGEGRYRAFIQPNAFDDSGELHGVQGYCTPAQYSGCSFTRAEDVRRYYRDVLYPSFRSGHTPARYLDLTPAAGTAPVRKP